MTYTIWSHGKLLGESALDYVRVYPTLRTGDLEVTEYGLVVMQRLTQTREDCYQSARRLPDNPADPSYESALKEMLANYDAASDQERAYAFELRAPDGSVIPTDSIHVTDTEALLARAHHLDEDDEVSLTAQDLEDLAAFEEQLEELEADHPPWMPEAPEREPVRFQINVMLTSEWSIP